MLNSSDNNYISIISVRNLYSVRRNFKGGNREELKDVWVDAGVQVKEMQSRLEEAESAASKGGKKMIQKMESRVHELESILESEQRRSQEADKNMRKHEKRVSELMAQLDESRRSHDSFRDAAEQLETKVKAFKRQAEEAVSHSAHLRLYLSLHPGTHLDAWKPLCGWIAPSSGTHPTSKYYEFARHYDSQLVFSYKESEWNGTFLNIVIKLEESTFIN